MHKYVKATAGFLKWSRIFTCWKITTDRCSTSLDRPRDKQEISDVLSGNGGERSRRAWTIRTRFFFFLNHNRHNFGRYRVMDLSKTVALFIVALVSVPASTAKELTIAALIPWNGTWPVGPRMASGLLVGIESVERLNLLPGYNISYVWRDSECSEGVTLEKLSDFAFARSKRMDVFIGPACSVGCIPGAHLASHWNVPMVSYGCADTRLSHKETFATFARTVGTLAHSGKLLLQCMARNKWGRVAIISTTQTVWSQIASFIKSGIDAQGDGYYQVSYFQTFDPIWATDASIQEMLRTAREQAHGEYRQLRDRTSYCVLLFGNNQISFYGRWQN